MTWDSLLTVLALVPVAALLLIGALSRLRSDLPREYHGLLDAAEIVEREVDDLRSRHGF